MARDATTHTQTRLERNVLRQDNNALRAENNRLQAEIDGAQKCISDLEAEARDILAGGSDDFLPKVKMQDADGVDAENTRSKKEN
jgi:uncharacterized protein YlxW (UPF0749 family)